jgi:hypothetical protein
MDRDPNTTGPRRDPGREEESTPAVFLAAGTRAVSCAPDVFPGRVIPGMLDGRKPARAEVAG